MKGKYVNHDFIYVHMCFLFKLFSLFLFSSKKKKTGLLPQSITLCTGKQNWGFSYFDRYLPLVHVHQYNKVNNFIDINAKTKAISQSNYIYLKEKHHSSQSAKV